MIHKVKCTDGRTVEFDDSKTMQGGEKLVFFTKDKKEVVCFFFKGLQDRMERRRRLDKIIGAFNPTTGQNGDYWKEHFCWPTHVIDGDASIPKSLLDKYNLLSPPLAVVAPAYRQTFFFKNGIGSIVEGNGRWFTSEKCRKLVPLDYQGVFLSYLQVCTKMARAIRRMHFAGLAHSDLSNKNVLIAPKHGDACIIDIDSLVVPGIAPPSVIGTPGYIAPEVLAGKSMAGGKPALPCIETDRHALAVLIYENLLTRHPLYGPKVNSSASSEEDDRLTYGAKALFVEHSTDRSNHLRPAPKHQVSILGPYLEDLFRKAFEVGLHDRSRRPAADQWERALYRTFDIIHPSPDGKNWFVLAPGMPLRCPFTGQKLHGTVPYAQLYSESKPGNFIFEKHHLVIYHNMLIHDWHIRAKTQPGETADRNPKGYCSFHNGRWYMVNTSGEAMQIVNGQSVPNGQSVEIQKGVQLLVSNGEKRRLFVFDFMNP
jgi:hypothetical protein